MICPVCRQFAIAAVTLFLTVSADAQSPAAPYRIGPKDLLEIKVFEVPDFNVERRVSEEGTVALPLVGDVPAQGLTDTELAARIAELLEAKYVQRASVSVQVKEFRSKPISVIGAVKTPGNLAFSGRWTLLQALAAAGGLTEQHGDTVYVLRSKDDGGTERIAVRVDDLLVRAEPSADIPVYASDVINVPARVPVTVFCVGEVKNPGALQFSSNDRITLLTAIARAGGPTDRASRHVTVRRQGRDSKEIAIDADYKRVLAGKDPDIELHSGDLVVVKESIL